MASVMNENRYFKSGARRVRQNPTEVRSRLHPDSPGRLSLSVLVAVLCLSCVANAQTTRSTRYDGTTNARSVYAARPDYDTTVPMTIEAWVYRYDGTRCETIVGHGWQQSYWLGFCPNLRFYRSGGSRADATVEVPLGQWTHVAASYDGSTVRFFIDGQPAGVSTLSNAGAGRNRELRIGSDANGGYHFSGQIDEVRIWSRALSQAEIAANMYQEVRSGAGLVGAWPLGGGTEALHGWTSMNGSGVVTNGYGILPRNLRIPRAAITPIVDGYINVNSEYAGAEILMVRVRNPNAPFAYDSAAYFVHDDNYLYVGYGYIRWPYNGQNPNNSYVGLLIDPTYSRTSNLDGTHAMLAMPIAGSSPASWHWGGAANGGFAPCSGSQCPPAGSWAGARALCGDDTSPPCVEFKVPLSVLGSWNELDGFALAQFNLSPTGDLVIGPGDAIWNSPATWATAEYTDGSAQLPRARIAGRVFNGVNPNRSQPLVNWPVYAGGTSGNPSYVQHTDSQGNYSFDIPVPIGESVRVEIMQCSGCLLSDPYVSPTGIQPTARAGHRVNFPSCPGGTCDYASVEFFNQQPVGATTITGFTPPIGWRSIVVRVAAPPLTVPSAGVRLSGANLHDQITLFLAREQSGVPIENWEKYEAPVLARDPAWTWIEAQVPNIPTTNGVWKWVIRDNWVRPGYVMWVQSAQFPFGPGPYPIVYGFGFDNKDDDASFTEFLSSYGNNSYLCVGTFGACICRVVNPLYILYYPIYRQWINSSGGSCMGISGTSLMFAFGALNAQSFDSNARFPRGILQAGDPANYDLDACSAPDPEDLWAYVRNNHGAQTSNQAITYALEQMFADNQSASYESSPTARLNEVRARPIHYAISVAPGIGEGHVVLPWKVTQVDATRWRIHVYDNNSVYNVTAPADDYIEINTANDTFTYRHPGGEVWSGRAIFTYPYQLFSGGRDAPGLVDALSWMLIAVFGSAELNLRGPGGTQWGWNGPGTGFVDNMPGVLALNPLGPSGSRSRQVPAVVPHEIPAPQARITPYGQRYLFHAAADMTMLQVEAFGATSGAVDRINVGRETRPNGEALRSIRLTPASSQTRFQPRIGMQLGLQQAAVFKTSSLQLPANQSAEFVALHERRGIAVRNFSTSSLNYFIAAETVDGEAEINGTALFGPFVVPAGAIHTAVIHDWPACSQMRSEMDLNADGTPDTVTTVPGARCGDSPGVVPMDDNQNGIPDLCEATPADMNCDGLVNNFDIDAFVLAITDAQAYRSVYPDCLIISGDLNRDGLVNNFDIGLFVGCLESGGCN